MSLESFLVVLKLAAGALAFIAALITEQVAVAVIAVAACTWWIIGTKFRWAAHPAMILPLVSIYADRIFYLILGVVLIHLAIFDLLWYQGVGSGSEASLSRRLLRLVATLGGGAVVAAVYFHVEIGVGFWPTLIAGVVMIWAAVCLVRRAQADIEAETRAESSSSKTSRGR